MRRFPVLLAIAGLVGFLAASPRPTSTRGFCQARPKSTPGRHAPTESGYNSGDSIDIEGGNLQNAYLYNWDLSNYFDVEGTNLTNAYLAGRNISGGQDLSSGAIFDYADFTGANSECQL